MIAEKKKKKPGMLFIIVLTRELTDIFILFFPSKCEGVNVCP